MTILKQIGEASRSLSLDNAASDYVRYVKTQAVRSWWWHHHRVQQDELQIATAHRGVSSRLKSMLEMHDGVISDAKKQIERNVPVPLPGHTKTAVAVGGIDVGWGGALAPFQQASAAFLQSLAPYSAFDRLLSDNAFTRLPLRTRAAIASSASVGSAVSEGQPKPVAAMSFSIVQLPVYKAVGQVVMTDETVLSVSPAADRLFESEMQKMVALATDVKFLEIVTEDTGVASNASTGLTAAALLADLATALEAIEVGVNSRLYWILPASIAQIVPLRLYTAGIFTVNSMIGNIRIIATSAPTADGVLLDASAVAADSDIVTSQVSNQSDVIMQDSPTAGQAMVSLFQNNLTLVRSERFFGATVLRPEGIAVTTGMATTA